MRKSSPVLKPLFSTSTQHVLAAMMLYPSREWYLSDLATHLGVGPSSLQRVLRGLTAAGILRRWQDGNRIYYAPDETCPILGDLRAIMTKTLGLAEPLREALAPFTAKISLAFIHGSIAEGRERSESDIDLIIVGDVPGVALTSALQPLHDPLGRVVNFTRYTLREFESKIADGNHFLTAILHRKRIFLIGSEHELGEIAKRKAGGI